jgi:UDP:flavonoid glycosyltransferase YjiC (YdhE family)
MAYDQFDNAERLRELGIGIAVPVRSFRADRVSQALDALLSNPTTVPNCQAIAKRMASGKGLSQSAQAVERLIARTA